MDSIQFIPVQEEHLEMIRNWRNSEEVAKYMYTNDQITAEQQIAWYEKIKTDKSQQHWVIRKESESLGLVSLYSIKPQFKTCYWAYYLGSEASRGVGIGAKIEYKLINYVFEEMKFNKLICEVFVFNESVIKLHEKFGFRREGYYRQHIIKNGLYQDVVSLAILRTE